jgi:hypothetical protein
MVKVVYIDVVVSPQIAYFEKFFYFLFWVIVFDEVNKRIISLMKKEGRR